MATINLRLYGEQIYPNISKYLSTYINPEIQKEEFVSMYKNGKVEVKQISLKEKLSLNPQIKIENASIEELKLNIPNEEENFSIYLNNMKCLLSFSDIKEDEIEKLLIENKKKLIDEFIKYAVAKIEKKDGASFLDNLIKSVIDKILNGLTIEIHNLEMEVKIDNGKNKSFTFIIEDINYSDVKGIKIKNTCLIYKEDFIKINVIDKFDFNIDIIHSNEEGKPNKLNLTLSDFKLELNKNIYFEFLNFFNLFDNAQYKKIYIRYKKLIQFHKPILKEGKKDYKALWYYAIKTVIKLQKYTKYNKQEIFDLIESSQVKIIKKYLENKNNDERFLLPDKKNTLKSTKAKVEEKVIENKKGNVLANAFSFFFSAKKEEDKKELTEEEKEIYEEIFKDSNLINYINGNINNDKNNNLNSVVDKIKKFLSNISIDINITKLELILHNINIGNKQSLFIKGMRMNLNYINKEFDFKFIINDIGYEKNKSFFDKNELFSSNAIEFGRDKNNIINLSFGFKNIELNEDLFMCLITFFKSIQTKPKQKLFKERKYNIIVETKEEKEDKDKENEIIKNLKNFSFLNNFNLSNIPSFSVKSKYNKIEIKVTNYSITETSLGFTLNIRDSYGEILKDFTFNPKIVKNKFIFHLDSPLSIILSNQSTKSFFLNYLRYKKELSKGDNNKKVNINKNDELFGFNYTSYTNIDLSNIDMNNYGIDIIINKIDIKIFEEEKNYQSSLVIDNLKFLYEKKNLDITLDNFIITTNLMSTMILYFLDFESPLFAEYQKKINFKNKEGDVNTIFEMFSQIEVEKKNDNNNLVIKNELNYGQLLKEILNKFNFKLNKFSFIFQANKLIMALIFNSIICFKSEEKKNICVSFNNWYFLIESPKLKYNNKNKKIIENNTITRVKYEIDTDIIKGLMKSVYFNINLVEVVEIWENISFLMNQINWDIILCKMDFKVEDFVLIFDQFKYSISKISFANFKKGNINSNAFYFHLLNFIMTNENNNKIIYEKEFYIDYIFKTSIDNEVIIKCDNPNIHISQHDISFLLLCIKLPKKKEEEDFKRFNSVAPFAQQNNNNNKVDLLGFEEINYPNDKKKDNKNKIITKSSMRDNSMVNKKKFSLTVNLNISKFNVCLCLNDYTKVSEFSIESSKIKVKYILNENAFDKQITSELSYSLLLGILNFKYFSDINNEYTILTKRKNNHLEEKEKENKNIIKEKDDNKNNQIEIISDNNGYTVNINENEVNVRFDSLLLIYYYFKGAIPIDEMIDNLEQAELNMNNNKKNKIFRIQLNFTNSQFQLCTSVENNENLYLDINKFIFIYNCCSEGILPYGSYVMTLGKISANIISNNYFRELFFTTDDFLNIKIDLNNTIFSSNIIMDILTINLSYRDLLSFLRVYSINLQLFKTAMDKGKDYLKNAEFNNKVNEKNSINNLNKIKKIPNKKVNGITPGFLHNKKNLVFTGELNFEKLDITLIENSEGSYHPFMNFVINRIYSILNPDNKIESTFSFLLSSYNYISCIWEPTIEKTVIKLSNIYTSKNADINNRLKIEINTICINLSDMAISFTLLTFNKWLEKLELEKKKNESKKIISDNKTQNKMDEIIPINIEKITNNQVINYTGIDMRIVHNGKEISCPPIKKIELDYINEYNKSKKKCRHMTLIYDNKNKFEIPLEKIVTLRHIINNEISIVSDNSISENRSINIYLYSPIIFKNKSILSLQIQIKNKDFGQKFLVLNPNSIIGLPLNFVNKDTYFNFMMINPNNTNENNDYSQDYRLDKILNINTDTKYEEKINFKKKSLIMKLDHKIRNVRTLIINSKYSIVNCLPCDIYLHFSDKKCIIKKCSQYFINNTTREELFIGFSMILEKEQFMTEGFNILSLKNNEENNFIEFKSKNQRIKLKYYFKKNEEENTLIIYSEYILYNDSGIILTIYSKNKDSRFCFNIGENICLLSLISSKNDYKEAYIQLYNNHYISEKINFSKLVEIVHYLELTMKDHKYESSLKLNIKKKFSYISLINNPNFKENISSTVFTIFPSCIITNLSKKIFYVCDYDYQPNNIIIGPSSKKCFHFLGNSENANFGITVLNSNSKNISNLIKFKFKTGIFTLSTGECLFNLEIRKNPTNGCLDVFVIENTLENSQIILENLTDEGISIYQNGFEKYNQIISPKETQTLKIFSIEHPDYMIETSNTCYSITFNTMQEQEKRIQLNKKIVALIQANGIKMKVTFHLIEQLKRLNSVSINNFYSLNIVNIIISIIGDNEFQDTKLNDYQRNELLLLAFSQFSFTLNVEKTKGVLDKDFIQSNIILTDFSIYNQMSKIGKFSCLLKNNEPFFSLYTEIDYYRRLKIIKIRNQKFTVGKLDLGIDPKFIIVLFDFWDNILYRMNITNFNVHEIFMSPKKISQEDNKLLNEYEESKILLNANNFYFPELKMKFEVTRNGLTELLKRMDCSDFYIWLGKGLVGRRHSLNLSSSKQPYNYGSVGFFFQNIYYLFMDKLESQLTEIGLKGFLGQFKNIFTYDETAIDNVQRNRLRIPRAFYGKFKYFKTFDKNDAYLINIFFEKHKLLRQKYFPLSVVLEKKYFFLFTTLAMFCVENNSFDLIWNIDYYYVQKAETEKNVVKVIYNQVIDSKQYVVFKCPSEEISKLVAKSLNEEKENNKENILEI